MPINWDPQNPNRVLTGRMTSINGESVPESRDATFDDFKTPQGTLDTNALMNSSIGQTMMKDGNPTYAMWGLAGGDPSKLAALKGTPWEQQASGLAQNFSQISARQAAEKAAGTKDFNRGALLGAAGFLGGGLANNFMNMAPAAGATGASTQAPMQLAAGGVSDIGLGGTAWAGNTPGLGAAADMLSAPAGAAGSAGLSAGSSGAGIWGDIASGATTGASSGGGGGILDSLKTWLTGPGGFDFSKGIGGVMGSTTPRDVLGTAFGMWNANRMKQGLQGVADRSAQVGNALNDPQRQWAQGDLRTMMQNPQSYMSSNPFAQALTAQYRDNVIPRQVAQSGNPGQVIDQAGSQFATALAGNYNQQVSNLSGIAGYGFPPSGYSPTAYMQAAAGSQGVGYMGSAGLGGLFGQNRMQGPMQGQSNTGGLFGTKIS